jgi:DNA-binding helix-hairpin-helix protein with protein kinase domain
MMELLVGGQAVRLGQRIGKGGEGEVYKVEGLDCAAKVYTLRDDANREPKIAAMIRSLSQYNSQFAAFPLAIAHQKDGRFAGFLMNLVTGHKALHELYAPAARKKTFPHADYRFLVRAATSVARAVASVHASNCVIGDLNHSGILISDRAEATLIDADSFQIIDGSQHYLCRVGVPEYTPPELQGKKLGEVVRTVDHDAFGLAVIIFQLLCMGRHPFSGAYASGEMPIERGIREHRFVYSQRRSVGMSPPPGSVDFGMFPTDVRESFEAAFSPSTKRPSAEHWVRVLTALEGSLLRCSAHELHFFPNGATACPWCKMEKHHGMVLFLRPLINTAGSTPIFFDIKAAWAAIQAVPIPTPKELEPQFVDADMPQVSHHILNWRKNRNFNAAFMLVLAGVIAVIFPKVWFIWLGIVVLGVHKFTYHFPYTKQWRQRYDKIQTQLEQRKAEWRKHTGVEELLKIRASLEEVKAGLEQLPKEMNARVSEYMRNRRSLHLRDYLEQFQIQDAKIHGIGAAKKAALISFGIETAADVTLEKVLQVNGFGPVNSQELVKWREIVESQFEYSPHQNRVDSQFRQTIEADIEAKARKLRNQLSNGARVLSDAVQNLKNLSTTPDAQMSKLHRDRNQLMVDLRYLKERLPVSKAAWRTARPTCPECNARMIRRVLKSGPHAGKRFWGCHRYPKCKGALSA